MLWVAVGALCSVADDKAALTPIPVEEGVADPCGVRLDDLKTVRVTMVDKESFFSAT